MKLLALVILFHVTGHAMHGPAVRALPKSRPTQTITLAEWRKQKKLSDVYSRQCIKTYQQDRGGIRNILPLSIAIASHNHVIAKEILRNKKVKVNGTDGEGNTALLTALLSYQPRDRTLLEMLELLIDHDADVNKANSITSRTPLHIAAMMKGDSSEVIEFLLAKGANPLQKDGLGLRPIDLMLEHKEDCEAHGERWGNKASLVILKQHAKYMKKKLNKENESLTE